MRRDFSERADDRISVARTEHENRLGLPFASRTLVFPFADRCGTRQVFPHAQKYAMVSRNWSSIVSPITAIVARYGLREFFCVLRLWGNRATVEIRPDCRAGLPYFCSIRNRYVSRPGHGRTVAVEANVAAVGREIGGRQKGPAVPVRFIAVASSSPGGRALRKCRDSIPGR